MASDPTLPIVKSLLLLDSEGKRIAVKYYSQDWWEWACVLLATLFSLAFHYALKITMHGRTTVPAQSTFEKSLWNKTNRTNARQEGKAAFAVVGRVGSDNIFPPFSPKPRSSCLTIISSSTSTWETSYSTWPDRKTRTSWSSTQCLQHSSSLYQSCWGTYLPSVV